MRMGVLCGCLCCPLNHKYPSPSGFTFFSLREDVGQWLIFVSPAEVRLTAFEKCGVFQVWAFWVFYAGVVHDKRAAAYVKYRELILAVFAKFKVILLIACNPFMFAIHVGKTNTAYACLGLYTREWTELWLVFGIVVQDVVVVVSPILDDARFD